VSTTASAPLLWLLADPDAPPRNVSANSYAFPGEARSSFEIGQETGSTASHLVKRVAQYLPMAPEPCGDLAKSEPVMAALDSIANKLSLEK